MTAPWFSTFAAISELFVTAGVFYVVFSNMRGKGFFGKIALSVILFEFFVNMLYMIVRMRDHTDSSEVSSEMVAFAAGHGFLSLVVFILFVVFSIMAHNSMKRGKYFFQENRGLTYGFVGLWSISILSGELLYLINYT